MILLIFKEDFIFNKLDRKSITYLAITILFNLSATLLSLLFRHFGSTEVNFVVMYILSVLLTSRYTKGYMYGIIASFLSMFSFNFFFTEPIYSLNVYNTTYVFTFIVILFSAIFTSALTSKLLYSKELSDQQEKQSQILYQFTSSLAKTSGVEEVATASVQCLANHLNCEAIFFIISQSDDTAKMLAPAVSGYGITMREISSHDMKKIIASHYSFPITFREKQTGFVCLPKELENMTKENQFLLNSLIMQINIAIQREMLTAEKEAAKADIERERLKSSLLRAISHDLRTPLTGIMGSTEMLMQKHHDDEESIKLLQDIFEESGWLVRLVENILSLTRVQEGRLNVQIQPEAAEEIVGEAVRLASKYAPNYEISVSVPKDLLFVPMDGKLIIQVLINLIDNAIKHTKPSDEIKVAVYLEDSKAWFEVSDRGTGIDQRNLPKIFDLFFTTRDAKISNIDSDHGIGLGLAICKAIVNFHGGEIFAENNKEKGSTFRFYLNI